MKFTTEFKQKVYDALQFNPYLSRCMEALEKEEPGVFRYYLQQALEEVEKASIPRELHDEGDRLLWNGLVIQLKALSKIYSEFMDKYTTELDAISNGKIHSNHRR